MFFERHLDAAKQLLRFKVAVGIKMVRIYCICADEQACFDFQTQPHAQSISNPWVPGFTFSENKQRSSFNLD